MGMLLAKIITQDIGLLTREETGIEQSVQAVQVDVWEAAQEVERHLLVFVCYPEMDRSLCEKLESRLYGNQGDVISFVVRDEPGRAIVFIPARHQRQSSLLHRAAAIAVVKHSWGWDESEKIEVQDETAGEVIELDNPRYENGRFEIEV